MSTTATGTGVVVAVEGAEPLREGACRVIAEAGVNHNNSVERAIEMARRAAEAGAWGIKYQLYKADSISVPHSPKYSSDGIGTASQYEAFALSDKLDYGAYGEVAGACRELGSGLQQLNHGLVTLRVRRCMPVHVTTTSELLGQPLGPGLEARRQTVRSQPAAELRQDRVGIVSSEMRFWMWSLSGIDAVLCPPQGSRER